VTDGVWLPPGKQTFFHPLTGALLVSGKVYHYVPATDTPKDTWQDEGLTVLNTNPITLDAGGQATIWGDGLYRQVLFDADGVQLWDQVTGFNLSGGGGTVTFATPAEVAALSDPTIVISPYALGASGVLGGSSSGFYPKFTSLGGVGNGDPANPAAGTNNAAAFATAVANGSSRIWINDGTFRTTGGTGLQKYFDGSGKIFNSPSGEVLPGRYTYLVTPPTQYPTQGIGGWFAGQTDFIEAETFVIGAACRTSITDRYFEATTIPHNRWFISYGGSSSVIARLASGISSGAGTATLNSVDGLSVGNVIGFSTAADTGFLDTVTIDTIDTGTKVITFHPNVANAYLTGAVVALARRTNNPFRYLKATNYAAGDFGSDLSRVIQQYTALAGQTHFFDTSTVYQYGGDINFQGTSSGTYATGWESQYNDNGNDAAVIAQVDTFTRTNDTGARSVIWFGTYFNSAGSKPSDAAHVITGKWRVGIDTVRADLTTWISASDGYNAAISTALGHRWIMNSTANAAGRGGSGGLYPTLWGNTPGDMFIESGNDGTSDFIALRFNRAGPNNGRIRLRPDSFNVNVQANFAAAVASGTGVYATTVLGVGAVGSGEYIKPNTGTNKWEFYVGGVLVGTVP